MVAKKAEPSPEGLARAQRQRIAMEDGAKAIAEFDQRNTAVRKNMERLRALRIAKEAEDAEARAAAPAPVKAKRKKPAAAQ
jgi:hypothetical protein